MPRKGKRKRLARGIYEDGSGRSVVFRNKERRFPKHTPISELRDELDALKRKLKGSGRASSHRGTLAAAVDAWESQEQHLASWKERRAELRAWVALYGDLRLTAIKAEHIRRAFGIWTAANIAPKTIRNRRWSLKRLYQITLGPDAETPVDHVDPPARVRTVITTVTPATILSVYAKLQEAEQRGILRDAKTRARFMVRAATGRRPAEIMRAKPEDVDLEQRIWRVRDAKGGWSEGLYLNSDMLAAWSLFATANAWGPFETSSMAKVLHAAGWPAHIRPYNLRHSIGIGLSEQGHDLADVGGWLGHTDVQTTRSAYVPILRGRMQRLSESLEGRLNGWTVPTVPRPVPRSNATQRSKVLQTNDRADRPVKTRKRRNGQ